MRFYHAAAALAACFTLYVSPLQAMPMPQQNGNQYALSQNSTSNGTSQAVEDLVVTNINGDVPVLDNGELAGLSINWGAYLQPNQSVIILKYRDAADLEARSLNKWFGSADQNIKASGDNEREKRGSYAGNHAKVSHKPSAKLVGSFPRSIVSSTPFARLVGSFPRDVYKQRPNAAMAVYRPPAAFQATPAPTQQRRDLPSSSSSSSSSLSSSSGGPLPDAALQEAGWKFDGLVDDGPIMLYTAFGQVDLHSRDSSGGVQRRSSAAADSIGSEEHVLERRRIRLPAPDQVVFVMRKRGAQEIHGGSWATNFNERYLNPSSGSTISGLTRRTSSTPKDSAVSSSSDSWSQRTYVMPARPAGQIYGSAAPFYTTLLPGDPVDETDLPSVVDAGNDMDMSALVPDVRLGQDLRLAEEVAVAVELAENATPSSSISNSSSSSSSNSTIAVTVVEPSEIQARDADAGRTIKVIDNTNDSMKITDDPMSIFWTLEADRMLQAFIKPDLSQGYTPSDLGINGTNAQVVFAEQASLLTAARNQTFNVTAINNVVSSN